MAFFSLSRPFFLFSPLFLAFGIGGYFCLPDEPAAAWVVGGLVGASVLLAALRKTRAFYPALILFLIALGFSAAALRTALVATPMLARSAYGTLVTGRVIGIDTARDSKRLLLDRVTVSGEGAEPIPHPPRHLRLYVEALQDLPPIGARIQVPADLRPISGPVLPGGYDFRRDSFFQGIGATGYARAEDQVLAAPEQTLATTVSLFFARLNRTLSARTEQVLEGDTGAIMKALFLGEQSGITAETTNLYRISGLAHILSISGLHIAIVAGLIFAFFRFGLALIPFIALRWPIKKIAAAAALLGITFYTLLVDAPVPTQRSLLMTGLVLLAVLVDRTALSLRVIALAACTILLIAPDSLLGPSFQLSFAAVAALIAGFEAIRPYEAGWRVWLSDRLGWFGIALLYLAASIVSSLIATLATTPIGIYHFQQIALFGFISNMLVMPLSDFWIMPMGLIAYLALPFGLEYWPLKIAGYGIDLMTDIAAWTASLPYAQIIVPAMPFWGLLAVAFGGYWLVAEKSRLRLYGLLGIAAGLFSIGQIQLPDVLVSEDAKTLAVRDADGQLWLSDDRNAFLTKIWLHQGGQSDPRLWPGEGGTPDGRLSCDKDACYYQIDKTEIAFPRTRRGAEAACETANLVVSRYVLEACAADQILDKPRLEATGAVAIRLTPTGPILTPTRPQTPTSRPWMVN
jgi:competence protein ComEC